MADGGTQMIKYLTMTIGKQKNIALIAHDGKKQDMLKWCMENKEILQRVEKQCNIIKTEMEALIYKLYRVNAVYEKVEQKNKKLIQKIQNNQTGKGYKISLRSSHLLKEWNGKICIRLECGESFIVEDWLIDFLAQR